MNKKQKAQLINLLDEIPKDKLIKHFILPSRQAQYRSRDINNVLFFNVLWTKTKEDERFLHALSDAWALEEVIQSITYEELINFITIIYLPYDKYPEYYI